MPARGILQFDSSIVQTHQERRNVAGERLEDDKLERSPGLNLVRVERSSFFIFAYVEKEPKEERGFSTKKIDNISKIGKYYMVHVVSLDESNDFTRENAVMELDLLPGDSRGNWKCHATTKWFKQAKAFG